MANEVAAAFVGAGATISAAGIPLIWNGIARRKAIHLSKRRGALLGRWEGKGADYYIEDTRESLLTFGAAITFTVVGHTVKASASIQGNATEEDELSLSGMFYNDDYLQLAYFNKNIARKQLGVVVLGLQSNGTDLRGCYAGFSPRRETIVAGTIRLTKRA
jgi:hypothetical protein